MNPLDKKTGDKSGRIRTKDFTFFLGSDKDGHNEE